MDVMEFRDRYDREPLACIKLAQNCGQNLRAVRASSVVSTHFMRNSEQKQRSRVRERFPGSTAQLAGFNRRLSRQLALHDLSHDGGSLLGQIQELDADAVLVARDDPSRELDLVWSRPHNACIERQRLTLPLQVQGYSLVGSDGGRELHERASIADVEENTFARSMQANPERTRTDAFLPTTLACRIPLREVRHWVRHVAPWPDGCGCAWRLLVPSRRCAHVHTSSLMSTSSSVLAWRTSADVIDEPLNRAASSLTAM